MKTTKGFSLVDLAKDDFGIFKTTMGENSVEFTKKTYAFSSLKVG